MSSVVEICNLALGNIRAGSINDIDEASFQAQQCKLRYPIIRDKLLTDYSWSFAVKVQELELLNTSVTDWAYVYSYPNDSLKIERLLVGYCPDSSHIYNYPTQLNDQVSEFKVINHGDKRVVLSNTPNLSIMYRARITDSSIFPASFVMAFSYLLAADLAIPVVSGDAGRSYRSDCYSIFNEMLNEALTNDTSENHYAEEESEFITIRR